MAGKAIMTCRPNSHPFQERTLNLEQPVKIGRSVARTRPAPNNALFDCKVLSRNHAMIWYANGKFFLQDTKSSNGTFVNNQRLSKSGDESAAREVSSGDIVQFGVDVLENSRKVTHGCIVAILKLYLPDGKEAKASESTTEVAFSNRLINVEDLYELHHYLQDAIQREHLLETKLLALQAILNNIRKSADQGWKALIAEDSLLTRVEALENQLQLYSKTFGQDKLKEDLQKLQEDKTNYQSTTKLFLKRILDEKLDTELKCDEVKRSLINLETQCSNLSEELSKSYCHIQDLAQKLSTQMVRNDESVAKLQELEEQHTEALSKLENRNHELEELLARQQQQVTVCFDRTIVNNEKSSFDHQPKSLGDIEIDEDTNKENRISNITNDELQQLTNSLEKERKCKEVLELIMAQRDLLQAEKHARLQQINSLQDDYDEYSLKKQDVEDECKKVEASIESLEAQVRSSADSFSSETVSMDEKGESQKLTNGRDESLEAKIKELKAIYYEAKASKGTCENNMSILKEDINLAKDSLSKTSGSCLITQEKLEKAQKDYEECYLISQSLTEQVKLKNQYIFMEGAEREDFQSGDGPRKVVNENSEKTLDEIEQVGKQNRNDSSHVRAKMIMSDIDSVCESNKILDELHVVQEEYLSSQKKIAVMELEILSLKEDCSRLSSEKELLETEFQAIKSNQNVSSDRDELFAKVTTLEEKLVTLASQYMKCNEERVALSQKLASTSLECDALSHQSFFNLVFALPCMLLFLALAIISYPTLSHYLGTAE